jgi:serine/threonine protein kinase
MLAPEIVLQGRYRIIRQLGQGGMGAVYEAIDQRLDTTVALKETLFGDERLRKQFEREARLLARLHHPALPRVSDHFSEGDGQFLVMQFIPGDDLAEMLARKRGAFSQDQVLTWADQLLDVLDYLHTQDPQIVHRDIKPQNLKLTSRGQIILLDFGLAKGQAGDISRVTSVSIFGYTPNYAPLEQIQGLGTDSRSDIYALGATLYHLLTGVKPPDALSRAAALVNGQPDPLQAASDANAAVPVELDELLQKAMAQNREQRYRTAAEMRKSLHDTDQAATVTNRGEAKTVLFPPSAPASGGSTRAVVGQETATAGETTVVRRPGKLATKKRTTAWLLSSGTLLIVAVGVLGLYVIQNRNRTVQGVSTSSPTTTPSQSPAVATPSDPTPEPSTTTIGQEPEPQPTAAPAKKPEKSARAAEPRRDPGSEEFVTPPTGSGHSERPPSTPDLPNVDVEITKRSRANSRPVTRVMPGGVIIRDFPDGSQMMTTPDGTRIYTAPDGKREVFRPGQRFTRRRLPAKP